MVSTFFRKYLFRILLISYLFSSCGGAYKPGDESLVTVSKTNLKLASIMPFWVYHCQRNLTLKLCKKYFWVNQVVDSKITFEQIFFWATFPQILFRWYYYWLKVGHRYAKYSSIIIIITIIIIRRIAIIILK